MLGTYRSERRIQTFDTDCGRIGIVICYDVEFPELSRLMADDGMKILFVPFMTDTQNAYSTRSCMRPGTRHRKRMLRGNSRKCGQPAARSQHGHTVCAVGSVHSLRLRIPQRRQARRSNAQHRDDSRIGCRPLRCSTSSTPTVPCATCATAARTSMS